MHFSTIIALSLPVLGALAAPKPNADCPEPPPPPPPCTTTPATTTTASATSSTVSLITYPTKAFGVISARSASPVHLLSMNAAGQSFYLGGGTASYCPESVQRTGQCPPGNATAILGTCAMDVLVPGGQQIYCAPDGHIAFTQAHSIYIPTGSVICPFTYEKDPSSQFGRLSTNAFGATGLMACPTDSGFYQVFAAIQNATVPRGNVSECLGFSALAVDYTQSDFAAWQYT